MRPFLQKLSQIADYLYSVHPNAGLPNQFGEYDQTPSEMATIFKEFGEEGLYNSSGCCGTTAEREVIKALVNDFTPRAIPASPKSMLLSGLEPLEIKEDNLFINIGEQRCYWFGYF